MLSRNANGDLQANNEHLDVVEDLLEVLAIETTLVPADPAAPEDMLPPGVNLSQRAEFDCDTGVPEFSVRVEGLHTDAYSALFEAFFSSGPSGRAVPD